MFTAVIVLLSSIHVGALAQTDTARSTDSVSTVQDRARDLSHVREALVITVEDEVDLGMVSYIERAIEEAEAKQQAVLLHINTFGGRVDAATKIRDAVLNAKIPASVAFIDKRAISAGALIALSAQHIVMSSGATMGAATPVYGNGEKGSEKVVSYMRGEMRSTAERHGRNPLVAEAMVDESVGLDSISGLALEKGKLLTLTTEDAKKVGYLDFTAESLQEALTAVGLKNAKIEVAEENFGDKLVRFLTNGLISSILIMLGLGGIFYTVKTGHIGSITLVAVFALLLFFGGQYITEIAPTLAILVFLVGIGLLIAEAFIPSFGILGVVGISATIFGLFLALAGDISELTPERLNETFVTLAISLVGVGVIVGLIIKYGPTAPWIRRLTNQVSSGDMTEQIEGTRPLLGKHGVALTQLRPAGIALIDEKKVDVVTAGEFLLKGAEITVVDVTGNRVVVRGSQQSAEKQAAQQLEDSFGGRLPHNLDPRV